MPEPPIKVPCMSPALRLQKLKMSQTRHGTGIIDPFSTTSPDWHTRLSGVVLVAGWLRPSPRVPQEAPPMPRCRRTARCSPAPSFGGPEPVQIRSCEGKRTRRRFGPRFWPFSRWTWARHGRGERLRHFESLREFLHMLVNWSPILFTAAAGCAASLEEWKIHSSWSVPQQRSCGICWNPMRVKVVDFEDLWTFSTS